MIRAISLASALLLGAATLACAEMPGPDWMSKDALMKQMESQGYSAIVLKADDGRWEGQAIKDGKIIEFNADPHTGVITKELKNAED
jgi:hypothetical protein